MNRQLLTAGLGEPVCRLDVIKNLCRGKEVLDIGCVQHDAENAVSDAWLHKALVSVATKVVGVDYLEKDIADLRSNGYDVVAGDVTRPLAIDRQFDVIVVGNLIEHLSNFEGLFENLQRLLRDGGYVLISTANPFYREQYFYSAFKNDILINPEHTCWMDPVALDQLARRFGFFTDTVHWVREKWRLSQIILNGRTRWYNMFTGQWEFQGPPSRFESVISTVLDLIFRTIVPKSFSRRIISKHGEVHTRRLLFLRATDMIFGAFWVVYRSMIVTAPINRYELYVSVLRR